MDTPSPQAQIATPPNAEQDLNAAGGSTEVNSSYFPSVSGSRRSSVSSSGGSQTPPSTALKPSQTGNYPLEALSREYALPSEELNIAKQLALEPRQRSLHDSLRRAALRERAVQVDNADTKAKKLAAAKAELLALASKA